MTDGERSPLTAVGRLLRTGDGPPLAELFSAIDDAQFHPHPLTPAEAERLVAYAGQDVYGVLQARDGSLVAYGMLRGWDEGYAVPSLGIAVRSDRQRLGFGRLLMAWLADEARRRGATRIRLRVHPENQAARRLYDSLGYLPIGEERGEMVMVLDLSAGEGPSPHGPGD